MKVTYFTPGPAALYPSTLAHFNNGFKNHIHSISHRSKQFQAIYEETTLHLKHLLNIPENYRIFFVSSGTEAMERIIENCVERHSFHFVNGSFSKRFYTIAKELGKQPVSVAVPFGEGFQFQNIVIPKESELICFTHNETSSGVMLPTEEIHRIAKDFPDKLIAVDIVSSVPYVNLNYKLLDIVFFSVQKAFGLPAGLGVMIVSPKAIQKAAKLLRSGITIGSYHNFVTLLEFAKKNQTPETPPVLEIYVFGKVIMDMVKRDIAFIRKDTEQKAQLYYDYLDSHKTLTAFVQEKKFRSQTIIVVDQHNEKGSRIQQLAENGYIVGKGNGPYKDTQFRIANFPAHTIRDVRRLIKLLDEIY